MKCFSSVAMLLMGLSIMVSSCNKEDMGGSENANNNNLIGTWDLVDIQYSTPNTTTGYREYWVFSKETVTIYDYENDNEIDEFGPYNYKVEDSSLKLLMNELPSYYQDLLYQGVFKIESISSTKMVLKDIGGFFSDDFSDSIATFKKRKGNENNSVWIKP